MGTPSLSFFLNISRFYDQTTIANENDVVLFVLFPVESNFLKSLFIDLEIKSRRNITSHSMWPLAPLIYSNDDLKALGRVP